MTTSDRKITVQSPLGENALLFRHMSGHEELGGLFVFDVELLSEQSPIDANKLLGKAMTVCMDLPTGDQRFFNGIVTAFGQTGRHGRYGVYQAVIHPRLWLLSQRSDCRVFQAMKAPDIIKQVLKDGGCTDIKDLLSASYAEREYCVQYRETDLAFITRLMEQEGIYYYFVHAQDKHTLVLADSVNAHSTAAGYDKVPYFPPDDRAAREQDHLDQWSADHVVGSHSVVLESYSLEDPGKEMKVTASSKASGYKNSSLLRFDYPACYTDPKDGEHYARVRQEYIDSTRVVARGSGNAAGLFPGCLFTVTGHPQDDLNHEYLSTRSIYDLHSNEYESAGTNDDVEHFRIQLIALDSQTPFRLAPVTVRPEMIALQSAVVTGGETRDVWTDKYGRVRVQFYWDGGNGNNPDKSCWLRVAQSWAGSGWGAQFIPRVGDEVLVAFLGGDPDRPIVVGSLYNADNMPPYALPDNATQSGIKTRTVKGGASNFNELRFEDKQGSEEVYLQAEKDLVELIKNGDQTTTLEQGNQTTTLKKGDQTTTLEQGSQATTLKQGNATLTLDAGNLTTKVSKGKAVLEAQQSIELKVGPSSVVIAPDGITLKGPMIKLQGKNAVQLKGMMAQIDGSGMVKIKGGLVNIN